MDESLVAEHAKSYQIDPVETSNKGVFIIHGFASNPDVFRPYASKFADYGFHTYVARIAGHGISPEYFATTSRKQWSKSIDDQFNKFSTSMDQIIVMGHSLGALHAIQLAVKHHPIALILLSPPIKPKSRILIRFHHLLPYIAKIKKYWAVPNKKVKLLRERGANIYEKHPLVAFDQMLQLIEEVQDDLPKLEVDTLLILGEEDEFVSQTSLEILESYIQANGNSCQKWKAKDASHALIDTSNYPALEKQVYEFVKKYA